MSKLIIALFVITCLTITFPSNVEHYKEPETVVTQKVAVKKVSSKSIKSKREYIAPTGQALEIALRVSTEAKQPLDTVSRIMFYESDGYKANAKNVNKNKSTDHGYFQINSSHIPEAKKMGLDIVNKPQDNATFAIALMKRNGLKDWKASQKNWRRS